MLLAPSDCPRLRFNVLSIDYARVTNCFYDYDILKNIKYVNSKKICVWDLNISDVIFMSESQFNYVFT